MNHEEAESKSQSEKEVNKSVSEIISARTQELLGLADHELLARNTASLEMMASILAALAQKDLVETPAFFSCMKAMNDSIISVHNAIMMIPAPPPSAYAEFMPRSLNLGNLVTDVEAIRNKVAGSRDY